MLDCRRTLAVSVEVQALPDVDEADLALVVGLSIRWASSSAHALGSPGPNSPPRPAAMVEHEDAIEPESSPDRDQ